MSQDSINFKDFKCENIHISKPRKYEGNDRLNAGIYYQNFDGILHFETPFCIAPFGINLFDPSQGRDVNKENWSLSISQLAGETEDQESVDHFFNKM